MTDIDEAWLLFHFANPHIYTTLVEMVRQAKRLGWTSGGMRMFWERLRWHEFTRTQDQTSAFKLNDHYPPRYARLIMALEPDLSGFFETRKLKGEK